MRQFSVIARPHRGHVFAAPAAQQPHQQPEPTVVFKSSVEQVAVAAIVRDSRGRLVKNLKANDFELIDDGQSPASQRRLVGAKPCERRDSDGRERQHGDQDGPGARNRGYARRRA